MSITFQQLADSIKMTATELSSAADVKKLLAAVSAVASAMTIPWDTDATVTGDSQVTSIIQSSIADRFSRMGRVRLIAANRGYLLPDDPASRIRQINSGRQPWHAAP